MSGWGVRLAAHVKALLADTLFKRLFALMWLALVISHVVAFLVVTRDRPAGNGRWPTLPSLPPVSFAPQGATPARAGAASRPALADADIPREPADRSAQPPGGAGGPRPWHEGSGGPQGPDGLSRGGPGDPPPPWMQGNPPPMPSNAPGGPSGAPRGGDLPTSAALLDYGVRLLIIAVAAWFGARWLSAPMRRLQSASRRLGQSLARNEAPPQVDERNGTVEVREAAHVFNEMSRQLSDQVHSRGLLVAAISHDLRTPLTRIRMRLEGSEGDPLAARSIADIREMDELIEAALEVFRGTSPREEPAEATDVFALVQALIDDLADLGHPVGVRGEPATARVRPAGLRRVVSNLVNNALRYGKRADVRVHAAGDTVRIVIEDEGPGIPEAELDAVTRPFYRLETSRSRLTGGSGLGLYIARDLVARQGGVLKLENRAEGGLRATIELPAT